MPENNWLHDSISKIESWREIYEPKIRGCIIFCGLCYWYAVTFSANWRIFCFLKFRQIFNGAGFGGGVWNTLLMGIGLCVFALIFCLDFLKAKKHKIPLSWEPWILVLALIIIALLPSTKKTPPPKSPRASTESEAKISLSNTSDLPMNRPGESEQLLAGQSLSAVFANMRIKVSSIASDTPQADVTTFVPGQGDVTVQAYRGNPFFTNSFNNKCYIASLSAVACSDNPRWVKIKVEQNDDRRASSPLENRLPQTSQWYLRIKNVECVPSGQTQVRVRPFRVEAIVNSQRYNFPLDMMFYSGLTNPIDSGDTVVLRQASERYSVQFLLMNLRGQFVRPNDVDGTNVVKATSVSIDEFNINDLPAAGTNFISMMLQPGQIKIVYEITTNR